MVIMDSRTGTAPRTAVGSALPVAAAVLGWGLLVLGLVGRMRNELTATLHRDEAIAWTYASLPVDEIGEALRFDVNPPVYFMALHNWLGTGQSGETWLRGLSLLAIVAAAAVAFDAARRLRGAQAGWLASAFVLLAPGSVALAGLARPYALAYLLGVLALGAGIAVLQGGGWRALATLSVSGALLPLTHYWGGLLLAAIVLALGITAWLTRQAWIIQRALVAIGIALLAMLPWAGTLVEQLGSHPLAAHQVPTSELLGVTLTQGAGGRAAAWVLGLAGALVLARAAWRRGGVPRPSGRLDPADGALVFLRVASASAASVVVLLWVVSQVRPLFTPNYAFVVLAPVAILVGVEMSRRWWLAAALVVALLVSAVPDIARSAFSDADDRDIRGPEYAISSVLSRSTGADDVVVTSPGRVLALRYYVGPDRDYVTPIGRVHQGRFDYRDRVNRLSSTDPQAVAERVARGDPGTRIAFVHDLGMPIRHPYWIRLDVAMDRIGRALENDDTLEVVARATLPGPHDGIEVVVFERRGVPSPPSEGDGTSS